MEYPSKYDFFLEFKTIFNDENKFEDYILVDISDNFYDIVNIKPDNLLGKRISEIVVEHENDPVGLKELYYFMIPKTRRKFERFIDVFKRWYLISIFSNKKDYLLIFYNDITKIKGAHKKVSNTHLETVEDVTYLNCYGYRDKQTNLYNKEFFEEELVRLDSKRQLPISIIMGDLNGLKLINDAFGHAMGDKALIKVAEILKKSFREEDIISRIGGDEFVILLPKTTHKVAQSIIDKMQEDSLNNSLDFVKISTSFGLATKESVDEEISQTFRRAEERMYYNKLRESKKAKLNMINYLKEKLEEITFETKDHYERLKNLSLILADKIGLSQIEIEELKLLCEYHDIGKIGISPQILQKESTLSNKEWDKVRRHSEIGYYILGAAKETLAIEGLILMHHERWDGKGYPGFLKEEEIPRTVRMFSIVDAYEAMVNERPYKNSMSTEEALNEIQKKSGSQFDPDIAKVFIAMMKKKELAI